MKNFVVYSTSTGEILRTGTCLDGDVDAQAGAGENSIEGTGNDESDWAPGGVVTAKGASTISIASVGSPTIPIPITGIPTNCKVIVSGDANLEAFLLSPSDDITFGSVGDYHLTFVSPSQLNKEVDINVS